MNIENNTINTSNDNNLLDYYKERVEDLEAYIREFSKQPSNIGIAVTCKYDNKVRIKLNNKDVLLPVISSCEEFNEGDELVITDDIVMNVLPEHFSIKDKAPEFKRIDWNDIGGLKSQTGRIKESIHFFNQYREHCELYGLTPSKGILLYGSPGCGKTMIAKAIASDMGDTQFVYLKGGELLKPLVGEAENEIKNIFLRARKNFKLTGKRTVIFIDEAEAVLNRRGSRISSDVDTTIVPTFLSEMDGFEDNATFIILATNFKEQLDPAIIRPGRIDLHIHIKQPSFEDTIDIFNTYYSKISVIQDSETLAHKSAEILFSSHLKDNVSGALINRLVQESAIIAIKRYTSNSSTQTITVEDVKQAVSTHDID